MFVGRTAVGISKITRILVSVICCLLVFSESVGLLHASRRQFTTGVVVDVQKHGLNRPRYGKRTDAPAPPDEYDYDISIRLQCSVYVGRYRTWTEYLPGAFAPNQSVEVSPGKHFLRVKLPPSGEIKMPIVRRYAVSGDSCKAAH